MLALSLRWDALRCQMTANLFRLLQVPSLALDFLPGITAPSLFLQVFALQAVPYELGFQVFGAGDGDSFTLQPNATHTLRIQWSPTTTGSVRSVFRLLWNDSETLQVTCFFFQ